MEQRKKECKDVNGRYMCKIDGKWIESKKSKNHVLSDKPFKKPTKRDFKGKRSNVC